MDAAVLAQLLDRPNPEPVPIVRLIRERVRWEVEPSFLPLLDAVLDTRGETVKRSPAKWVTVHTYAGHRFFIKRYRSTGVARSLKYLFKTNQARREWRLSEQLSRLGVPIVRHLGLGELWGRFGLVESLLVTLGFDGEPLDEVDPVDWGAVADFVSRMQDKGVLQQDLHPGNVLLNARTRELRLVDLKGTRVRAEWSRGIRDENLAFLRIFVPIPVTDAIADRSAILRSLVYSRRADRCLTHNREFARQVRGGLSWQVRTPMGGADLDVVLADPDGVLANSSVLLKSGRSATVGRHGSLVLKRYNYPGVRNRLKNAVRSSRARRAYRLAYHLELLGIPSPRPVALAERRRFGIIAASYLVFQWQNETRELGEYLRVTARTDPAVIRSTARLLAQLHREGFVHGDLKERNILITPDRRAQIIDLDSTRYVGTVSQRQAAGDLSRLSRATRQYSHLGSCERIAFLREYCRSRGLSHVPRRHGAGRA